MTTKKEKEVLDMEKQYWRALRENDTAKAVKLTDFPCILTGPQGVSEITEDVFTKMMDESPYVIEKADLSDMHVRMLNEDVAVVGYKLHVEYQANEKLTKDGLPLIFDAADSSTWIRRDGQWTCAMHSEAIVGDPFGRDRDNTN